jgi:ribosomal protein S18 acetylase RimI-like enzyme
MSNSVIIRPLKESDKDFILTLSDRFTDFELMKWRDMDAMKDAQFRLLKDVLLSKDENDDFFVAEDEGILGFLHVTKNTDFFTGEEQGYISSVVVTKAGEGKGIGKKLMQYAEEWAKSKGYKQLVLNVFSNNERAVNFYSYLDYKPEVIKMVKEI